MRIVNWGIIGLGLISKDFFIPELLKSDFCNVYAIGSRSEIPDDYLPEAKHYTYDELFEDSEIDAVYIAVPNALHMELSIKAMQHGKHVLCEKPLALNKSEGELMYNVAKENHVLLMEAFMYRYGSGFRTMNDKLSSGELGRIVGMQGNHGYTLDWKSPAREDKNLGGGCLYDVGCYVIDCMNYVAKRQNSKVIDGSAAFTMKDGVDWHTVGNLSFNDGNLGSMAAWFNGSQEQHMTLIGEKNTLVIPMIFEQKESEELYRKEAEEFSKAILGKESYLIPKEDTLRNLEVLDILFNR